MKKRNMWRKMSVLLMCMMMLLSACKDDAAKTSHTEKTGTKYRNVKVLKVENDVVLIREKKEMSVYSNLVIKGGDEIITSSKGMVSFRLDDDKYAKLGANSEAKFELEGDTKKGAIRIYLRKGSVYNEIDKPLSKDDNYEIHTPDGVMAVRGTAFEVQILDNNGKRETHVITSKGTVSVKLNNTSGEEIEVNAGEQIIIDEGSQESKGEPTVRQEKVPEQPVVDNVVKCPFCKKSVSSVNQHRADCNVDGHYICDSKMHSVCGNCNELLCNAAVHELKACGVHYPCDDEKYAFDGHDKMDCGHFMCELAVNPQMPHGDRCVVCGEIACHSSRPHNWSELCGCLYCGIVPTAGHGEFCEICSTCKGNGKAHGKGVCGNN